MLKPVAETTIKVLHPKPFWFSLFAQDRYARRRATIRPLAAKSNEGPIHKELDEDADLVRRIVPVP